MSKQAEPFVKAIDKKVKLDVLKEQPEWAIIDETINGLIANLASQLLNDEPVAHEDYIKIRYQIEGLRLVSAAFEAIDRNGKQAEEGLKAINGE
jgi:hypothetical protein